MAGARQHCIADTSAGVLLALYIAVGEKQGVSMEKLSGTIQNDILKEYAARGTYAFPPKPSMRLITDIFSFCAGNVPRWNTISISGYHIREAGSTAVQEVAFTLADGVEYLSAAVKAGLDAKEIAPRLTFFFNVHNDFLEEIAKFRAARTLWARLLAERFGIDDPRSQALRFHAQTAGSTLTAQQPDVNVVRVAIQALAAVLGGTQSLHTNSRDEALALPTEESVTIALRTQQILAHESGVASTVDPLAGSYCVESLTDRLEEEALGIVRKVDEMGGVVAAIERGWIQREIEDSAYRYGQSVESGERIVVGVNRFRAEREPSTALLRVDESVGRSQIEKLRRVRASRDAARVGEALGALEAAARGTENLMPRILDAVREYASVGEICGALRRVFGEYVETCP